MRFRLATAADADAVAALHAASWRIAYAPILDDRWLAEDLDGDRQRVWRGRLGAPDPASRVLLAEDGQGLAGFAAIVIDADPHWGSHVDNLHVRPASKGQGLGRRLLAQVAALLAETARSPGVDLYVYDGNHGARGFYARLGGQETGAWEENAPDGSRQTVWRVWWPDPARLMEQQP